MQEQSSQCSPSRAASYTVGIAEWLHLSNEIRSSVPPLGSLTYFEFKDACDSLARSALRPDLVNWVERTKKLGVGLLRGLGDDASLPATPRTKDSVPILSAICCRDASRPNFVASGSVHRRDQAGPGGGWAAVGNFDMSAPVSATIT
jgi:hypothetical protein